MPSPTPNAQAVALARLAEITGANDQTGVSITVHFNPASLQLQLSNELKDNKNNERKQYVAKTTAKLTMELLFDTTDTGIDVTATTKKIQAFLAPPLPESEKARKNIPPPLVLFEWGTLRFKGIIESYKETIDFFSAEGVPLRSSVNLTLSRQDQVFDEAPASNNDQTRDTDASSPADLANKTNSPAATRELAAANGQENIRFGDGSPMRVNPQVQLKPPAAFAQAGASGGLQLGGGGGLDLGGAAEAGLGLTGGADLSASGGLSGGLDISASGGISAGGGISGRGSISASAGMAGQASLSATEGAFAGLRTPSTASATVQVDTRKLISGASASGFATGAGALFQAGGQASLEGPAGLRADVGANGKLKFDLD